MSERTRLGGLLTEEEISYERLLFDPNNPRLFGTKTKRGWRSIVPLNQVSQESVQRRIYEEVLAQGDIDPIHDSILQVGFIPIDKMVVKQIGEDQYVVIEGNRRLAAIKLIMDENERGEITIYEDLISQFESLPVMVYSGSEEEFERDVYTIHGMRHVAGVKAWGPYERGRAIKILHDEGKTSKEISEILFLSVIFVNRILRTMSVLEQWKNDEEYSELSSPENYTHMYELVVRPTVREWAGWNSDTMKFDNIERFREMISWIVGPDETKITQSIQLRNLPAILEYPGALEFLRRSGVTMDEAHAYTLKVDIALGLSDYRKRLENFIKDLESLPVQLLRETITYSMLEQIHELIHTRMSEAIILLRVSRGSNDESAEISESGRNN